MGGLVARYYAEVLDRERYVRRVVTIGTPYQGSLKALSVLANGGLKLGPVRLDIADLARSLPSVAELLPMYACVGDEIASLRTLELTGVIGGLPSRCLDHAIAFHRELDDAARGNGRDGMYRLLVGHLQPTDLWASVVDGTVVAHQSADRFDRGDGTVPRRSFLPRGWDPDENEDRASADCGRHASLQQSPEVLHQLNYIATSGRFRAAMGGDEVWAEADEIVEPGGEWKVEARSSKPGLALEVELTESIDARQPQTVQLRPDRDDPCRYTASIKVAEPGTYRWEVRGNRRGRARLDPICDGMLCLGLDTRCGRTRLTDSSGISSRTRSTTRSQRSGRRSRGRRRGSGSSVPSSRRGCSDHGGALGGGGATGVKEGVESVLREHAKSGDVVCIYLAGHGHVSGAAHFVVGPTFDGRWPTDATTVSATALADSSARRRRVACSSSSTPATRGQERLPSPVRSARSSTRRACPAAKSR